MSVNRFLYATNFVVNAPSNRPSGPLVQVTDQAGLDLFKISVSGSGLERNLLELSGDLNGKGQVLSLAYDNATVSGSLLNIKNNIVTVTGPTINSAFNVDTGSVNIKGISNTTILGLNGLDLRSNDSIRMGPTGSDICTVNSNGMTVNGLLTVNGELSVVTPNEILFGDSHIALNAQYTSTTGRSCGISVTHKVNTNFTILRIISKTVISLNPLIYRLQLYRRGNIASAVIPANSIIQISGSKNASTNGYFVLANELNYVSGSTPNMSVDFIQISDTESIDTPSTIFSKMTESSFKVEDTNAVYNIYLSHVYISDLLIKSNGDMYRGYGNTYPLVYSSLGGNTYENVTADANNDTPEYPITRDVTICLPNSAPANGIHKVLNVKLPAVNFAIRGAEYKIINKQRIDMKVFTASNDIINNYAGGANIINYVDILGLDNGVESSSVNLISFYESETRKGWQII